jgi:hypothetical protein
VSGSGLGVVGGRQGGLPVTASTLGRASGRSKGRTVGSLWGREPKEGVFSRNCRGDGAQAGGVLCKFDSHRWFPDEGL